MLKYYSMFFNDEGVITQQESLPAADTTGSMCQLVPALLLGFGLRGTLCACAALHVVGRPAGPSPYRTSFHI